MSIEIRDLTFSYPAAHGKIDALRGIDLTIRKGSFVGFMGRTGCGKSTLMQLIAGLKEPDSGSILIDGVDIFARHYDRKELRKKIGIVFQYPEYQLFETTVEKDVAFGLKHHRLSKTEVNERVRWALSQMGFDYESIREQSPLALSGGEKRRVAIAGVLAVKPEILIFDEPVAGLDPVGREEFLSLVRRLNQMGTTILMVSHNADALAAVAERIVLLEQGKITADGSPTEVFDKRTDGISEAYTISRMLSEKGFPIKPAADYGELKDALIGALKGGRP